MEDRLGRGLSALLGEPVTEETSKEMRTNRVDINLIYPNENQPRKMFDETKINELANSISLHGVLQPIAVRHKGNGYEIVAGERRWRASKLAGLQEIPVYVVDCDETQTMTLALIENLQRTDLNPIEEAEAMKNLLEMCECRQEDLGTMLSKSRSYISNALRLLSLPAHVRELIRAGRLTAGHARSLIGVGNADEIADLAVANNWTVRQLETAMKDLKAGAHEPEIPIRTPAPKTSAGTAIDMEASSEAMEIAVRVAEALHAETKLKITKQGGVFTIICKSCEELETLVEKFISLGE
ncbi:MAG: ParB/RepB/Spo0J family partition protein [Alphaproteobacteria bacterium]|nr:ParB/RepB/Spo0J family partition protein [Alphaproteobacteria bacterium]